MATSLGYCDQAHMINEFRLFTGVPPTHFFQPHGATGFTTIQLNGRPGEWFQWSHAHPRWLVGTVAMHVLIAL